MFADPNDDDDEDKPIKRNSRHRSFTRLFDDDDDEDDNNDEYEEEEEDRDEVVEIKRVNTNNSASSSSSSSSSAVSSAAPATAPLPNDVSSASAPSIHNRKTNRKRKLEDYDLSTFLGCWNWWLNVPTQKQLHAAMTSAKAVNFRPRFTPPSAPRTTCVDRWVEKLETIEQKGLRFEFIDFVQEENYHRTRSKQENAEQTRKRREDNRKKVRLAYFNSLLPSSSSASASSSSAFPASSSSGSGSGSVSSASSGRGFGYNDERASLSAAASAPRPPPPSSSASASVSGFYNELSLAMKRSNLVQAYDTKHCQDCNVQLLCASELSERRCYHCRLKLNQPLCMYCNSPSGSGRLCSSCNKCDSCCFTSLKACPANGQCGHRGCIAHAKSVGLGNTIPVMDHDAADYLFRCQASSSSSSSSSSRPVASPAVAAPKPMYIPSLSAAATSSSSSVAASASAAVPSAADIKLNKPADQSGSAATKEENECAICLSAPATVTLKPCGHKCFCIPCWTEFRSKSAPTYKHYQLMDRYSDEVKKLIDSVRELAKVANRIKMQLIQDKDTHYFEYEIPRPHKPSTAVPIGSQIKESTLICGSTVTKIMNDFGFYERTAARVAAFNTCPLCRGVIHSPFALNPLLLTNH